MKALKHIKVIDSSTFEFGKGTDYLFDDKFSETNFYQSITVTKPYITIDIGEVVFLKTAYIHLANHVYSYCNQTLRATFGRSSDLDLSLVVSSQKMPWTFTKIFHFSRVPDGRYLKIEFPTEGVLAIQEVQLSLWAPGQKVINLSSRSVSC